MICLDDTLNKCLVCGSICQKQQSYCPNCREWVHEFPNIPLEECRMIHLLLTDRLRYLQTVFTNNHYPFIILSVTVNPLEERIEFNTGGASCWSLGYQDCNQEMVEALVLYTMMEVET